MSGLRPLQPRLYSISSSYKQNPSLLSITVAEVQYRSLEKDRIGVASTFLTKRLDIGDPIWIYISSNPDFRLPPDLRTPILMIGPGTGLAPFRSFILEKMAQSNASIGANLLFFGCRRRDQDFLYKETLEEWNRNGTIQLFTAFSREQVSNIRYQNRFTTISIRNRKYMFNTGFKKMQRRCGTF